MAAQGRRAGCGCCGCFFAVLLLLIALVVVGGGFLYLNAAEKLNPASAAHRVPLPGTAFSRQTYSIARQKLDHFFANPEREATFSNAEVNALLADSPELRALRRSTVAVLNQNSAEVDCSLAVDLPLLPRRYLNCTLEIRPTMRAEELELDVSRIEIEGKPVGAAGMHQYRFVVVPMIEKTFSSLNKFQGDRAVRDVRIENGNLVLSR
jgi:hypothetical protein